MSAVDEPLLRAVDEVGGTLRGCRGDAARVRAALATLRPKLGARAVALVAKGVTVVEPDLGHPVGPAWSVGRDAGAGDAPVERVRALLGAGADDLVAVPVPGARGERLGVLAAVRDPVLGQSRGALAPALSIVAGLLASELEGADLAAEQRMFHLVLDTIPQHIFWKNRDSVYLGCNQNFARVAGVRFPEAIVGKTDFDLAWRPEEAAFFRACDRRVMDNDRAEFHILEQQQQADGKQAWLDTNKVPLHDEHGRVIGVLGTYEDITARLALEEQLRQAQKMEAAGQLAGGVAHDFKNLMMIVSGQAELAQQWAADPRLVESLRVIVQTAERTARLADKLLTFARRQITRPEVVDLNEQLRTLAAVVRRAVPENIEIVTLLDSGALATSIDPSGFEQVVLNLVFNAKDAMPGGGRLLLRTSSETLDEGHPDWTAPLAPGRYVTLTVTDTGHGMSREIKQRIFEPFFTTKAPERGTGLGLSIVYGVVKQARGHVTVDSRPMEGTTFRIFLPAAKSIAKPRERKVDTVELDQRETVLVVEDDALVRSVTAAMVRELGHIAIEAANGEEALSVGQAHPEITILLTDCVMPILGGATFVRRFRATYPSVGVLCVSGYAGSSDDLAELLGQGVPFLPKPFGLAELARALGEVRGRDGAVAAGQGPR